ncbi:MAG: (d)CMP kinase [Candidatus Hydrogenedentota bacterium]
MNDALTDILTIDGPAGSGKSTLAKRLARRLGYAFLDSGAMYRAATWRAMHTDIDMTDKIALAQSTTDMELEMSESNGVLTVLVDDYDVSDAIRTPEVTNAIKALDGIQAVRDTMIVLQQKIASAKPTVAEGRDMGTVVFPNARWKVFLEASLEERTRRRAEELTNKGVPFDLDQLQDDIHARDENDRNRDIAPLRPADDAWTLDTSEMTLDEVEAAILQHVEQAS